MIELERHIEILLLSNDCVIVPGLGGFMAHHVEASYDEGDSTFLPPLRTLGFNPKLTMNDSLLVQSYVEAYDLSYPEALRRIEDEVTELRQHLDTEGCYELNDIGLLELNEDGNLVFTPCEAGILTPSLYGLSSFEMKRIGQQTAKMAATPARQQTPVAEKPLLAAEAEEEEEEKDDEHIIEIKMSWVRNAVAIAAAIAAFLLMTTPVSNSETTGVSMGNLNPTVFQSMTVKDTNMQKVDIKKPAGSQAAAKADTALTAAPAKAQPAELPAQPTEAAQQKEGYTIVLASYITKKNAEAFVEQLHKKGFDDAEVFVRKSVTRVILGSFASEADAHDRLRSLRSSEEFKEAWVMRN